MSLTEDHKFAQAEAARQAEYETAQKHLDKAWHEFAEDYGDEIIQGITTGKITEHLKERWRWYRTHA